MYSKINQKQRVMYNKNIGVDVYMFTNHRLDIDIAHVLLVNDSGVICPELVHISKELSLSTCRYKTVPKRSNFKKRKNL